MKNLSLNEMENVNGGWDWNATACNVGAAVVGGVFGIASFGLGVVAGIAIGAACQAGSEWGWDN